VPAGTGFHTFQESEVRIRPEALEALASEKDKVLTRSFPLLDGGESEKSAADKSNGEKASKAASGQSALEALLGGGDAPDGAGK
jgi:DNA-directed RNA polymerase subunit beta'